MDTINKKLKLIVIVALCVIAICMALATIQQFTTVRKDHVMLTNDNTTLAEVVQFLNSAVANQQKATGITPTTNNPASGVTPATGAPATAGAPQAK